MTRQEAGRGEAHLPAPGEAWTPIRLTRWCGEYLAKKGVENGRLDAELLLADVLDVARLDLYLQFDRPLRPAELEAFKTLLRRRAAREPLQYILGKTPFRELDLKTDSRALIPRPETEVLVEEVLAWTGRSVGPFTGADIGTGSGAIVLSLLKEGPFEKAIGTDPSRDALDLAAENARGHGLERRVEFRNGPGLEPLESEERFSVIVSNPPYIPEGERGSLQPEILEWEPGGALFGGPDGLAVLLDLVTGARDHLLPGGLLAMEVGDGQAGTVVQAMKGTKKFCEITIRPDLAGRERVVMGVASE
ncbi:MAG: peptide chain release factor N(5)-glutamine methyltransferase [Gemmatimonadetes bacterium]|nr:peptide chain release factor N(5)-glutamine methyltransferase [Gemmatimonadota bacterium]NNM05790.1 peptide chain release factor N(5)-glutamine methyltransferase [Gemmatimonadota bacterium]